MKAQSNHHRKNKFEQVLKDYEHLGLNVIGVNAKSRFYTALPGVTDPEQKRKIMGKGFIDVFGKGVERNHKQGKRGKQSSV